MLPLRLVGITMADEASNSFAGGVRNFLGAGGFLAMMFGGYFIYEKSDVRTGIPLIVVGLPLFLSPWLWEHALRLFSSARGKAQLEYLSNRDSDLRSSIITAGWRSAYGRWFAAQILVNSGQPIQPRYLLHIMAGEVLDKILDGDIEVRGRKPGQMGYEIIPRTYWQSTAFYVAEDPLTLWKIILCPRGIVEIAQDGTIARASDAAAAARTSQLTDYDSLLVDAYQFEKLWPQTDRLADKKRRAFLKQARRRKLNGDEIRRLSDPPIWRRIGFRFGLLFIVGLTIGSAISVSGVLLVKTTVPSKQQAVPLIRTDIERLLGELPTLSALMERGLPLNKELAELLQQQPRLITSKLSVNDAIEQVRNLQHRFEAQRADFDAFLNDNAYDRDEINIIIDWLGQQRKRGDEYGVIIVDLGNYANELARFSNATPSSLLQNQAIWEFYFSLREDQQRFFYWITDTKTRITNKRATLQQSLKNAQ